MADFQIAPDRSAEYIFQGFKSAADSIAQARARQAQMQMQQQQLQQQMAMEQKRIDLGYYTNDQTNARDYYGLDLKKQEMDDTTAARKEMRQDSIDEKAKEAATKYDPQRVQPVALNDPTTGEPIPGYYGIPMTGQIVTPGTKPTAPALGSDPTGTGNFYFDGKVLRPAASGGGKLPSSAVPLVTSELTQIGANNTQLGNIQNEIAQHQAAIAGGDNRYGFLNAFSRQNRIKDLQAQAQGLVQQNAASQAKISQIKSTLGNVAPGGAPGVQAPAPGGAPGLPQGPGQAPPTIPLMGQPTGAPPAPAAEPAGAANPQWPFGTGDYRLDGNDGTNGSNGAAAAPQAKALDTATAQQILQQAGGDKAKARQLARAQGYTF